jgi:hypothetical protein
MGFPPRSSPRRTNIKLWEWDVCALGAQQQAGQREAGAEGKLDNLHGIHGAGI